MSTFPALDTLVHAGERKIVFLIYDGIGGLPHPETGRTELETAETPSLDRTAKEGVCGRIEMVARGITPGSGPGHMALFGYDPVRYCIGRGVLEALGIDFELGPNDLAARGNFATVGADGRLTEGAAGRVRVG